MVSPNSVDEKLEYLMAREGIRDCLARYSQGVDRVDAQLLKSAYWPDAIEDHAGSYNGPAYPWIDATISKFAELRHGWKVIGNPLIRVHGEDAQVESYIFAVNRMPTYRAADRDVFTGARYLDHMQRRGDEWRILKRKAVVEWRREVEPVDLGVGTSGNPYVSGDKKPNDIVAQMFVDEYSLY